MLLDERDAGDEPIADSVLEPEPFPRCAELVLAQHILARGLRGSGNRRTIDKSGEGRPSV